MAVKGTHFLAWDLVNHRETSIPQEAPVYTSGENWNPLLQDIEKAYQELQPGTPIDLNGKCLKVVTRLPLRNGCFSAVDTESGATVLVRKRAPWWLGKVPLASLSLRFGRATRT